MDTKVKNREWVKNAAIVFLAVLLVLTFFSNTIMNRSLAEAATAMVRDGNIVAKVRGTGTVTANGKNQVKAKETRTIRSVLIKAGQEVNVGDVLFVLGEGDETELETAENTLRDLQTSYSRTALGLPTYSYRTQEAAVEDALRDLEKAELKFNEAVERYNTYIQEHSGDFERIRVLQEKIENCEKLIEESDEIYYQKINWYSEEIQRLESEEPRDEEKIKELTEELNNLRLEGNSVADAQRAQKEQYEYEISRFDSKIGEYEEALEAAQSGYDSCQYLYESACIALDNAIEADNRTAQGVYLELSNISAQIDRQQEKIKKLAGEEGNTVVANVSGTIDTVDCTAGDTVLKDAIMCTIEVPDMGHTLSFSVTNEQARRLKVGNTASVSNYYWGNEIVATLTNIRTDPKNPQGGKVLTFDLEGDVTTGAELTISVGQKSANYDLIVPNSSIRTDSNGSFVYVVEQKSSPLGNRYIAKRVSVEVLANDDVNSAVVAEINNGDYVITTTSAPIKNGDQVRMAAG